MRTRVEPAFLLDANTLTEATQLYHQLFADQLDTLIQSANRVCDGDFSFLGINFNARDPIRWQRDPYTGRDWPAKFYADVSIPFCDGTGNERVAGDQKHVWELNRHEFLIDCAKAFYLTGETQYARRVFQVITEWTLANPYLCGVNWAGPLEVAVRSLSWLWAYQYCRQWDQLSDHDHLRVIKAFYQHGAYLHRHIEHYTSPNNHLVGEATALYLLGCFFPEFDESPMWRKHGWDVLAAEPKRQFYDDGGSTEQATAYHHYCLGFLVLAVLTRLRRNEEVDKSILKRLDAAFSFSMWMTTPDGTVPRIGDTDDARSIRFAASPHWDFRNLLCLGAIMFHRADLNAVAGSYCEDALWLLGSNGYRTFQELPAEPPVATSRVFASSGYVVMRSGWGPQDHHVCFDCGPIGLGLYSKDIPIFTHGHADLLSFTLRAFGKPLLVDTGFYTYSGSPNWHRYTRDVKGHNTVSVDSHSQAKFNIANAWSCVTKPGPCRWHTDERIELAEGCHANFYGAKHEIRHHRAIIWRRRGNHWVIVDRLQGEGTHTVEVFFHFAPGSAKSLINGNCVQVMTEKGAFALLQPFCTRPLRVEIQRGEVEPTGGWIATSYGQRVPAPVVRFHGQVTLPFTVKFVLVASDVDPGLTSIDLGNLFHFSGDEINEALALERTVAEQGMFSNYARD